MRQSLSKKGESPVLVVRIPKKILVALKARVKPKGPKMSDIVREALEDYLAKPKRK